jgi:hypothetical protein
MSLLLTVLVANAIVHGIVVARFGMRDDNQPFLVFMLVYAALAVAVYHSMPYVLWAVLLLAFFGIAGLTVNFNKPTRDKALDKVIWLLDAATVLYAGYLLLGA